VANFASEIFSNHYLQLINLIICNRDLSLIIFVDDSL